MSCNFTLHNCFIFVLIELLAKVILLNILCLSLSLFALFTTILVIFMRCLIMTAIYKSFNVKLKMGQKLTPHADDDVKFT